MKILYKFFLSLLFLSVSALQAQDKPAYQLFDSKGKKVSYKKLIKTALNSEVILFGEYHNNPISHWLQLVLTKNLYQEHPKLVLGAEMLEKDNQTALNRYLSGEINQKGLDSLARLWGNYKTDYKPLVDFAKENKLDFIASNIPRRYASLVFRGGFQALDTLPIQEKSWIAPLPIRYDASLSQYQAMLDMAQGHGGDNLPKAQAIKDATMAHSILSNLKDDYLFLHYNGSYHSDYFQGIYWYLKQERPQIKIMTIATVSQADLKKLEEEHLNKADFILAVDQDMTSTH